ncbi:MAG: glycosyltransferase family 39 protein, partial [Tepidisphaeraceae bacterium]
MPRSARFWKVLLALLFAATVLYLLGARSVPLWDRDEPRYAQCSREMLQTGDWVVPKYLGNLRIEKPPMIYWCQMLAMAVEGDTSEAARFPSTVAVVLTILVLAAVVRHFIGDRRALWSVFIFCTCALTIGSAKFCITDAMMMFFVAIGQGCLAFLYGSAHRNKKPPVWAAPLFWISLGFAGLTKGPQALGMHSVTLIALLLLDAAAARLNSPKSSRWNWRQSIRWWWRLQPLIGLPLLAVMVTPWLVLVHQRAPGFVQELFHKAHLHTVTSMEGHGEPPGYHTVLIFATFFPWSLLLPTAVTSAWRNRRSATIRFAMAATIGPWLMMELIRTKLPFYILPAFPGLAFLTADALVRCIRGQNRDFKRPIFLFAAAGWALIALTLAVGPWICLRYAKLDQLPIAGFIAFGIAGVIYAALVFGRFYQQRIARAAVVIGVGMAIMIAILYITIFPRLDFLQLSERLADDLTQMGAYGSKVHVAMIGYAEPSLAFYQGGGAREQLPDYLQTTPPAEWPRWIVISIQDWQAVPPDVQRDLILRAVETGVNYSHAGRREKVF